MATNVTLGGGGSLFVGEDKIIRLELLDTSALPVDMSGWTMLFEVRLKDATSGTALISVTPAITGSYNAARATNTQRATATLTDDHLNVLVAKGYRWSWKRIDANAETVLVWGDFLPQKATAV